MTICKRNPLSFKSAVCMTHVLLVTTSHWVLRDSAVDYIFLWPTKKTRIITPDTTVCVPQLKRLALLEAFASNIKPFLFGRVITACECFVFYLSKEGYASTVCNIKPV